MRAVLPRRRARDTQLASMATAAQSVPVAASTGYVALLRHNADFRRFWLGQIVSQLGDWLDYVALVTLLLALTRSGTVIAAMLVARFLPSFFAAPIAGVVVDRANRKYLMVAADVCRALAVLGLLLVQRADQTWIAYTVVAAVVTLTAFFEPSRSASIPNVVAREDLVTANALGSITWSVSLALGAAIGGFITAVAGCRTAFVLDALSFAASGWLISGVRLAHTRRPSASHVSWKRLLGVADMMEGLRYLRGHAPVAAVVFVKTGWALAGGIVLLHNIFGERIYPVWGSAAAGIGLLATARGIGTAIGPIAARRVFGDRPQRMAAAITVGFGLAGGAYLVFARIDNLPLALLILALAHCGGSTMWVFSTTLLQMLVPDHLRGRVFAAELASMTLALTLSNLFTGWGLDHLGLSPRTLAAGLGALCFIPGTVWFCLQRSPRFAVGDNT